MAALDFPSASASPWVAPNGAIYTYIGTSPNGYWEANTANAAQNLTDLFVERSGSTMTGALKLDNAGNVALPDISFDGDVNTGLYSPGADSLALVTGGSARISIAANGDVNLPDFVTASGSIMAQQFIASSAGSAVTPAYRFSLGSGFFSPTGTNHVAISTNSTERLVVDSSGNVGIGTTAPTNTLHVVGTALFGASISLQGSGAQCALSVDGDDLTFKTINAAGSAYQEGMRIIGGAGAGNVGINTTSPSYRLQLGDNTSSPTATPEVLSLGATYSNTAGDNPKLRLWDQNSTNYMGIGVSSSQIDYICTSTYNHVFHTNSAERLRIDSSGRVGIGTTPTSGTNQYADRLVVSNTTVNNGNTGITIQGANSSLSYASLYLTDPGTTNRAWFEQQLGGGSSAQLTIGTSGPVRFWSNSSEKMRILASGGLTFNGDTAQTNALDDYEEGSFTPTVSGSNSAGSTTYTSQVGTYTKIGRLVHIRCYVAWSAATGSGLLYIRGLPYGISNSGSYGGPAIGYWHLLTQGGNGVTALWGVASDYVYFYNMGNPSASTVTMQNTGSIIVGGAYYIQ